VVSENAEPQAFVRNVLKPEVCDGLLLHPLVGETKGDDVRAAVRMESYKILLELYYPRDRAMLVVMPTHMRYGGPREAVLHAIVRRNYGCLILSSVAAMPGWAITTAPTTRRDFRAFRPRRNFGITPLAFENTFYCRRCGAMASYKTCPHQDADRLLLSGTKVREMLRRGEAPPPEFTRPEIAAILVRNAGLASDRAGLRDVLFTERSGPSGTARRSSPKRPS
jgi:sulfate adenylyltransferase